MKRGQLLRVVMALAFASVSFSIENEFIKKEKEKIFYPSCQQCLELYAAIITSTNEASNALNSLNTLVIEIQKEAITGVNDYLEGEKGSFLQIATKKQRAVFYSNSSKRQRKIDEITIHVALLHEQLEKLSASHEVNELCKAK